jgi:hypothetical protein
MTPLGNKDICWLDISMDNAFRVRGVKPVGNVNRDIQQFLQFHRPAMLCFNVSPSRYSIAMNVFPLSSPMS